MIVKLFIARLSILNCTFNVFTAYARLNSSEAPRSLNRAMSVVPQEDGAVVRWLHRRSSPVRSWRESRGCEPMLTMKFPSTRSPSSSIWRTTTTTGRWTDWNSGCLRGSRAPKASVVFHGRRSSGAGGREAEETRVPPKNRRNKLNSPTKRPGLHSPRPRERRPGLHSPNRPRVHYDNRGCTRVQNVLDALTMFKLRCAAFLTYFSLSANHGEQCIWIKWMLCFLGTYWYV